MSEKLIKCPSCHGEGYFYEGGAHLPPGGYSYKCNLCNGKGEVTQKLRMAYVRSFKQLWRFRRENE